MLRWKRVVYLQKGGRKINYAEFQNAFRLLANKKSPVATAEEAYESLLALVFENKGPQTRGTIIDVGGTRCPIVISIDFESVLSDIPSTNEDLDVAYSPLRIEQQDSYALFLGEEDAENL
jgi:hypothetical protein